MARRAARAAEQPDAATVKEAADQWFAAFLLVRAAYPMADIAAVVAATDWAMKR